MTEAQIDEIIGAIENGDSLRGVCSNLKVSASRFLSKVANDEELRQRYTRAMEIRADVKYFEMQDLAEFGDDPAMIRAKIDAQKWIIGKMRPMKYGDTTKIEHSGAIKVTEIVEFGERE
jgi:hypothetical protein